MSSLRSRAGSGLLCLSLLAATGCGPEFFSSKGQIASDGGPLDHWSATPAICSRDEFDGDSSKLVTFMFANPASHDPDRDLHRDQQPNSPLSLKFAKNGDGVIARLDMMKPVKGAGAMQSMDGYILDNSSCKTLKLDRTEQSATFGSLHKPLKGELVLDCKVDGSHVTADITFKHCGL